VRGIVVLDDKDVLDAVQRRLGDRSGVSAVLPGAAEVTWVPLLEGTVERCIEARVEKKQKHHGPIDLSSRPVYDTLAGISLDPPGYPFTATTKKLVQRGSVAERLCECGNGSVTCPRCQGRGELACEPTATCPNCHGIDPCARCHGTGRRTGRTSADITKAAADHVTCRKCGASDAACSGCHGQGRLPCPTCQGKGTRDCPGCDSAGTVAHNRCGGTGGNVTWTEGIISRMPKQDRVRLPETGPARLARWYARDTGHWNETTLSTHDALPCDLARQFTTLRTSLTAHTDEITRRAKLRYLPMARVTLHQQPHRIYYVFPGHNTLHVRALPSRHRTWQVTAALLALLALVAVVLALT
jgi:hypothetical protein